jgi:hypothetical protein
MPNERSVICLVGPQQAGKTSLLATWVDCIARNMHGFENEKITNVRAISSERFHQENPPPLPILDPFDTEFEHWSREKVDATRKTESRFFEIDLGARGTRRVEVTDSPGEHSAPTARDKSEVEAITPEAIATLTGVIQRADGAIVAIPLVDMSMWRERTGIDKLVRTLATSSHPKPRRFVLAFTHYDRLFVEAGNEAWRMAAHPGIMRDILQKAIDDAGWRDALESFARRDNREVYLTASGAYGFVMGNGSVNIDPNPVLSESHSVQDPEQLERELKLVENPFTRGGISYGQPFLTADPFLCAILGAPGSYAVKLQVAGHPRPSPDSDRSVKIDPSKSESNDVDKRKGLVRKIFAATKDFLNTPEEP